MMLGTTSDKYPRTMMATSATMYIAPWQGGYTHTHTQAQESAHDRVSIEPQS